MKNTLAITLLAALFGCSGEIPFDPTPNPAEDELMESATAVGQEATINTLPDGTRAIEPITQFEFDQYKAVDDYPELFDDAHPVPLQAVPDILKAFKAGASIEQSHQAGFAAFRSDGEGHAQDGDEIGSVGQGWHSALYHGLSTSNIACYNSRDAEDCWFPKYKSFVITSEQHNPNRWFYCTNQTLAVYPGGPIPQGDAAFLMNVYYQAMGWHDRGAEIGAYVRESLGGSSWLTVTLSCDPIAALGGTAMYFDSRATRQAKLQGSPVYARQYTHIDIHMNPMELWTHIVRGCAEQPTANNLARYAEYNATHELMHAWGFGHFSKGVMRAGLGCGAGNKTEEDSINATYALMTPAFEDALEIYSGGFQTNEGTLHDTGLFERQPSGRADDIFQSLPGQGGEPNP